MSELFLSRGFNHYLLFLNTQLYLGAFFQAHYVCNLLGYANCKASAYFESLSCEQVIEGFVSFLVYPLVLSFGADFYEGEGFM